MVTVTVMGIHTMSGEESSIQQLWSLRDNLEFLLKHGPSVERILQEPVPASCLVFPPQSQRYFAGLPALPLS